jgi:hypothetical protein
LPSSTALGGIGRGMAVTGTGVAFASGYTLLIYDGDGNLVASVSRPQPIRARLATSTGASEGSRSLTEAGSQPLVRG